jgi:predicted small lipoprotein YifL
MAQSPGAGAWMSSECPDEDLKSTAPATLSPHAVCYAGPIQECPELSSLSHIWAARGAVIGAALIALVAGMGLAGCGRKGGLDPPPVAAPVDDRGAAMQPAGAASEHVSTGQALPA